MAMHIVQLGPVPPPEGGVSRNLLAIRDELRKQGHKCTIIATSRSSAKLDDPDIHYPKSAFDVIRILRAIDADVVHLHIGGDLNRRVLSLAKAVTVFGRGRKVLTVHSGAYPLTPEARAASPGTIRGRIFRGFDRIIGVNDELVEVFRRYGVGAGQVRKILPYSLGRPDPKVEVPPDLVEFLDKHSPALLAVGGLEEDYDPLFQIDAMDAVVERLPNAGLLIVGDGSMRDVVNERVAASRHNGRVLIAGNLDHGIVLHLIQRADVLLRTTLFDGDAISIREAMFLGTPVVATDTGMRPAGVFLIPIRDQDAYIQAVAAAFAAESQTIPSSDANQNVQAVIDLYREVIAKS